MVRPHHHLVGGAGSKKTHPARTATGAVPFECMCASCATVRYTASLRPGGTFRPVELCAHQGELCGIGAPRSTIDGWCHRFDSPAPAWTAVRAPQPHCGGATQPVNTSLTCAKAAYGVPVCGQAGRRATWCLSGCSLAVLQVTRGLASLQGRLLPHRSADTCQTSCRFPRTPAPWLRCMDVGGVQECYAARLHPRSHLPRLPREVVPHAGRGEELQRAARVQRVAAQAGAPQRAQAAGREQVQQPGRVGEQRAGAKDGCRYTSSYCGVGVGAVRRLYDVHLTATA